MKIQKEAGLLPQVTRGDWLYHSDTIISPISNLSGKKKLDTVEIWAWKQKNAQQIKRIKATDVCLEAIWPFFLSV